MTQSFRLPTALLIFTFCASLFILTGSGRIAPVDGTIMYEVTQNLVDHQNLAVSDLSEAVGADGRHYAKYGLGQSLLAVPLYLGGKLAAQIVHKGNPDLYPVFAVALLNQLVTALTCMVLYLWGRRLGWSSGLAVGIALVYGFGSLAWPYAKLFFSEPLTALGLASSAFLLGDSTHRSTQRSGFAGSAAALAILTRLTALLALPALLGYLYLLSNREAEPRRLIRRQIVVFLLPTLGSLALTGVYDTLRFGIPWETGYTGPNEAGWTLVFWPGLVGFLVGPGKSLFLFSPIILLAVPGLWLWRRGQPAEAFLCTALPVSLLVVQTFYTQWYGGWTWGPRLLLPTLPFLVLAAGGWFAQERNRQLRQILLAVCFLAGFLVNAPAVLVTPDRYDYQLDALFGADHMTQTAFDPRYWPVAWQWRNVAEVTENLLHPDRIRAAILAAGAKTGSPAAPEWDQSWSSADVLQRSLSVNVPNLWLVFLAYAGFPWRVVGLLALILGAIPVSSGWLLYRAVNTR